MRVFKQMFLLFPVVIIVITLVTVSARSFDLILPDTGQDLCYDWERIICDEWHMDGFDQICDSPPYCPEEGEGFYGQDGTYTINPPDLTDNGDGTVTDNLTNIIWEQKTELNEPTILSYDEALTYCENLSLGGSDNWRLPTRKEYSTICNLGSISPALDTTYFPHYTGDTPNDVYYWTSSEYYGGAPDTVWRIQISFGIIETASKVDDLGKVRCVLADPEPTSNFTDNGNGTVTDNVTGLMWEQKTDDGGSRDKDVTHTWLDALNYCENLVLGNYSDWKLPTPKELERIVDISTNNPAVDTTYFPNTTNGYYWTGTTCSGCHKFKAFAYDFSDGDLYFGIKYKNGEYHEHSTRCVRQYNLCEGNFDCDGDCDGSDAAAFKADFGRSIFVDPCTNGEQCQGDFDCDVDVDGTDAALFKADFGRSTFSNPCPACEVGDWCSYP